MIWPERKNCRYQKRKLILLLTQRKKLEKVLTTQFSQMVNPLLENSLLIIVIHFNGILRLNLHQKTLEKVDKIPGMVKIQKREIETRDEHD